VRRARASLVLTLLALATRAAEFDPWFGDGMVLQRDQPILVRGTARPGATVLVRLGDTAAGVHADSAGRWSARFPARPASPRPLELEARDGIADVRLGDVLIGDVWLAAGQSNMEFPLRREAHAAEELPRADLPRVRLRQHAFAGQYVGARRLDADVVARMTPEGFFEGTWTLCTPASAGEMSAVGYYFARRVAATTGVPIGLVNYSVGGAPIESFISVDALRRSPDHARKVAGDWLRNESIEGSFVRLRARQQLGDTPGAPKDGLGLNHGYKPGFAWAAGPGRILDYPIKGVLWYQGESNAIRAVDVEEYAGLMKLLVADWREQWRDPSLPFLTCQLPAIAEPARLHWPRFREAQRRLEESTERYGMAVTLDLGAPKDVHPKEKREVGERLARWALFHWYGHTEIVPSGPLPTQATYDGQTITVSFRFGKGLAFKPGVAPQLEVLCGGGTSASEFQPVGPARLDGDRLLIDFPADPAEPKRGPAVLRYAWAMDAQAALVNEAGLPATPFQLNIKR
jgi:sialate O-acetylesterase